MSALRSRDQDAVDRPVWRRLRRIGPAGELQRLGVEHGVGAWTKPAGPLENLPRVIARRDRPSASMCRASPSDRASDREACPSSHRPPAPRSRRAGCGRRRWAAARGPPSRAPADCRRRRMRTRRPRSPFSIRSRSSPDAPNVAVTAGPPDAVNACATSVIAARRLPAAYRRMPAPARAAAAHRERRARRLRHRAHAHAPAWPALGKNSCSPPIL